MSLQTQLTDDMKQAMRDKNQVKLDTIRFTMAQLKNKAIDKGDDLTDQEIQQAIAKQIKQQQDAIAQYKQAGRDDLVDSEQAQVDVLSEYLPKQLSDEELAAEVKQFIADNPDAQMGQLIGMLNKKLTGSADGGRIAAAVKAQLGS